MIKEIRITFPAPVDFPDGFENVLSTLISMVCEKYERDNPERVMWPAGQGFKPIVSMGDITGFQEHIYSIDCEEGEDLHGRNPFNPRRAVLREAARASRNTVNPVDS